MCDWFDFDIDDWMIIGPLSEEMAYDEKETKKIEKEFFDDDLNQDEDYS